MIYTWAHSLDVDLTFEDRSYTLGNSIDVKVELNALRDVTVRRGHVDLVYEVRWIAPDTVHHPLGRLSRPGPGGNVMSSYSLRVPTKKMVEHKHSYVLGSTSFLDHTRLDAHTAGSYNARILIHKDDPPYADAHSTGATALRARSNASRKLKPLRKSLFRSDSCLFSRRHSTSPKTISPKSSVRKMPQCSRTSRAKGP